MGNRPYMTNKYKLGDRVVVIGGNAKFYGRNCTIVGVDALFSPSPVYQISFGDDSGTWLCREELLGDVCEDDDITPEDMDLLL